MTYDCEKCGLCLSGMDGVGCTCEESKLDVYWLIYYEYWDGTCSMGCNITIKQSPASWLAKHRKAFPDELVMLKFAMPITEEERYDL